MICAVRNDVVCFYERPRTRMTHPGEPGKTGGGGGCSLPMALPVPSGFDAERAWKGWLCSSIGWSWLGLRNCEYH